MVTLGQRIKHRREELRLSQGELARRIGLSYQAYSMISRFETDKVVPKVSTLKRLSEALQINLFDGL